MLAIVSEATKVSLQILRPRVQYDSYSTTVEVHTPGYLSSYSLEYHIRVLSFSGRGTVL